jgi:predicted acylesterase/phospholipase RssA
MENNTIPELTINSVLESKEFSLEKIDDQDFPTKLVEISQQSLSNETVLIEKKEEFDTLVLSGCSVKAFVTLGALQYCEENGFLKTINKFVGTSSGSMLCYLLAIGYTPLEILKNVCTNDALENMKNFDLVKMMEGLGATDYNHINQVLEKMTIEKIGYFTTLGKLLKETGNSLTCVTYNNTKSKAEYLSPKDFPDLPCLTAIRMSSNLPFIFSKFKYMNCDYDDGGFSDNFPILYGEKIGNKVLGLQNTVNLKSFTETSIVESFYKKLFTPVCELMKFRTDQSTKKSTVVVLNFSINFFDFNVKTTHKMEMFSTGYQTIKSFFEKGKEKEKEKEFFE